MGEHNDRHVDIVAELRKTYLSNEHAAHRHAVTAPVTHGTTMMTDSQLEARLGWTLGPADRPDRR